MSWEVRTMRSGTSYFNKTLFAKHFARFWPIWGLYGLIWTVCLPLSILAGSRSGWMAADARVLPLNYLDTTGWVSAATLLAAVFGLLAAMAVFSYLYSARSVSLFHALPLRREGLFLTSYLAGLGFLILPNLAVFLLALAAEAACGAVVFSSLFTWLVVSSLLGLFFYSFAVFCAMFTGHILALPAFYVVLNGLAAGLAVLFGQMAHEFLFGFDGAAWLSGIATWLSPLVRLSFCRVVYPTTVDQYGNSVADSASAYFTGLGYVALYALVGAVLAVLALVAYRRRQLETAGDVVSVSWVRPVFKYGVAFCAAVALGETLYSLFSALLPRGAWGLLLMLLLWGAAGYFVAEMLLRKKFWVFRGSWKGCVVLLCCLTAAMCLMEFDVTGFERRVPDPARVQSVSLDAGSTAPYDDANGQGLLLDGPEDIAAVTELHRAIVARKAAIEGAEADYSYEQLDSGLEVETSGQAWVQLRYTLTDGSVVTRSYRIPLTQEALNDPDTPAARLDALLNAPGQAEKAYFGAMAEGDYLISAVVTQPHYDEEGAYYYDEKPVDSAGLEELWSAVQADLADGSLGRRYLLENQARLENCYVNDLILTFRRAGQAARADGSDTYSVTVTLQTTGARTLAALEQYGFDLDSLLTQAQAQLKERQ